MPHTSRDGVSLYWEERGAGDPLLLIMGLGVTLEGWSRLAAELADRYRIILFDNRGVGRSDVPPGPYAISTLAADVAAVLDAAGIDAAHVFGVSMGGMIAQEFALAYPSRVRSLILGCTTCGGRDGVPARAPSPLFSGITIGNWTPTGWGRKMYPFSPSRQHPGSLLNWC